MGGGEVNAIGVCQKCGTLGPTMDDGNCWFCDDTEPMGKIVLNKPVCEHNWEQKFLLTSHYYKCKKCGEEK